MVEMAISSNASATIKISPLVDESDREGGDLSRRATAGSSTTLTRLSPGKARVCIDNFLIICSYC